MTINDIKNKLDKTHNDMVYLKGKVETLETQLSEHVNIVNNSEIEIENNKKAIEILNYIQSQTQDKLCESFETVVSYALQYIYEEDSYFKMFFDRKGNLGTLDFSVLNNEIQEPLDLIDNEAGGIIDILALSLRVVLMEANNCADFIIFDESFKHLSVEYRDSASKFLGELNKRLDKQIIMVTHCPEFKNQGYNQIEV